MNKYLLVSVLSALAFPAYADVESFVNAAQNNDFESVQSFVAQGENVNAQNSLGNTALHFAVNNGNIDMVRFLLDNGADASISNSKGFSPTTIAEKKQFGEILNMFQITENDGEDEVDVIDGQIVETPAPEVIEQPSEPEQPAPEYVEQPMDPGQPAPEYVEQPMDPGQPAPEYVEQPMDPGQPAPEYIEPQVENSMPDPGIPHSDLYGPLYVGDEEVVFCLYLLGLTDKSDLTKAAEYYAGATNVTKNRYKKIAGMAKGLYDNAPKDDLKTMAGKCSGFITPQDREKQNQIIRSINKAFGY